MKLGGSRKIVLALFALLALMAGRQLLAQAGKTPVVLWHSYRADERKALEEVVSKFNATHAKIQVNLLAVPNDAFPDKISAAVPQGKGPDLFIFAHDRLGDWAENKIIEPIDFWVDDALKKRFMPQTVAPLVYRKSLYGLPMAFKSTALFYNKTLVPIPPKTTDELIAMAKKLTDKSKKQYGLVYENANFYHHSAWLFGFGGQVFDGAGKLALNTPQAVASLKFAQELRTRHGIVPEELSSVLVTSLFNEGKAAMAINGPWFRGELKSGLNYGVAMLPTISQINKPARPFMGSEALLMSTRSKNKEAAFEVMTWLTDIESARIRLTVGKQTVANAAAYQGVSDPMLQVFRAQLDQTVPMPNTPQMLMVWQPATTALNKVVNGGGDPAAALKQAQTEIEQAFKSSRR